MHTSIRVGAAAFALGLSLAGPHAAGTVAADTGADADLPSTTASGSPGSSVSSGSPTDPVRSRATARRDAARAPDGTVHTRDSGQTGTASVGTARSRAKTGNKRAEVTVGQPALSGTVMPASVEVPTAIAPQPHTSPAAAAGPAWAATAARRADFGAAVSPAPVAAPAAVGASDVAGRIGQWLAGFPGSPVSDFVSGALLMVRRTMQSAVTVTKDRTASSTADGNGPVLTGITSTPGSRSLVLTFDGPLIAGPATDLANYRITAPGCGNPEIVTSSGPALKIVDAQYSDAQVTLTLARPLKQGTFYRIVINGSLPIVNGNPNSNPLTGLGGITYDGDNDDTAGGNFYGLFAVGRSLCFTDSSGDRVSLAVTGGSINVWRELNGDIDQITVLPGAGALSGSVIPGKQSSGTVYVGSLTVPVPAPLNLNGATNNLSSAFQVVPPGGLTQPPPVPTGTSPTPVDATSANLPYTMNISPVSAPGITNLPGIQAGVYAQTEPTADYPSGLWVVLGGRTNGLHNFSPSGEQSFPPSFQNNVIYVINPVDWQVWSRPWSQTDVPASVYNSLSAANAEHYQKGDTLYVAGGYSVPGTASFTGDVSTASTTITVTGGLENLAVGQRVSGVLPFPSGQEIFPAGTTITAINGNTVTTSLATEAAGTGVSFAAFTRDFKTYDTLTALSLSGLAQAVINGGEVSALAGIRQMSDPRLAVTGGDMAMLNGRTYLVFGHDFQGGYNGATASIAQVYSDEIRSFRIIDTGRRLAIVDYRAQRNPVDFRRRDGNLVNFIGSDGRPQLAYLGGVFSPGDAGTGYQAPILIGSDGSARVDAAYQQYFNQYTTANIGLYDPRSKSMYTILIGGISLYYYKDGVLTPDTELPWVDNVTSLVRAADGSFQEYSMTPIAPVTPGGTGYYGASAAFFGNQALDTYCNGVVALDELRGPTVLGYMYGGIYSTVSATGFNTFSQTGASNQVFQVTLTPTR